MHVKWLYFLLNLIGFLSLWIFFEEFHSAHHFKSTETPPKVQVTREIGVDHPFMKMHFGRVYIFGVAAGNSSENSKWDLIKVYASIDLRAFASQTLECCLKYAVGNRYIRKQVKTLKTITTDGLAGRLKTIHTTCPNVEHGNSRTPVGVGLTNIDLTCQDKDVRFVKPVYPKLETTTKLSINTQVAFGDIQAEIIIEWMETYLYLGVDKVITYIMADLNNRARQTLHYYSRSGVLELHKYTPAQADLYPRNLSNKVHQTFFDLRLPTYDSFERMSGYTYYGIIDFDEFLIPSQNRSLKQLLDDLCVDFPNAAGFLFKSQLYSLSWEPSGEDSDMIISKYIHRVAKPPSYDRPKNILVPKYIQEGGVRTHFSKAKHGKRIIRVAEEDGYIRHYRRCRVGRDATGSGCMNDPQKVLDKSMAEWSSCIKEKVIRARERIFGSRTVV